MSNARRPRYYFSARAWICILGACAMSPFLFVALQGYMTLLTFPTLSAFGVSSSSGSKVVLALGGLIGSLTTGALLCIPLGWFERKRPALLGAIVGMAGCVGVSWIWFNLPPDGVIWSFSRFLELGGLFAGCVLFAVAGARRAHRVAA